MNNKISLFYFFLQGYLYKRSTGSLKEWKKKYVIITDDQMFTYYPYMKVSVSYMFHYLYLCEIDINSTLIDASNFQLEYCSPLFKLYLICYNSAILLSLNL